MDCTEPSPQRIRVRVKDAGAGLAPEKPAQLFQPFNQLGQEANASEGTGIGLVVSKKLIELMGGVIGVESAVDKGLEAGFFCYLTKPIKVNEFVDTLDLALKYADTHASSPAR